MLLFNVQAPERPDPQVTFLDGHPRADTHFMKKLTLAKIPNIIGRRFPSITSLDEDNAFPTARCNDLRERYAANAMVLFVPWRTMSDLKEADVTWWSAWSELKENTPDRMSAQAWRVLDHIQGYYRALVLQPMESSSTSEGSELDDWDDMYSDFVAGDLDMDELQERLDTLPQKYDKNVPKPMIANLLDNLTWSEIQGSSVVDLKVDAKNALEQLQGYLNEPALPTPDSSNCASPTMDAYRPLPAKQTTVQLLYEIGSAAAWQKPPKFTEEPARLPQTRPTITEQSQHWCLDRQQHHAFALIATALLEFLHNTVSTEPCKLRLADFLTEQHAGTAAGGCLRMFLNGEAGSGKSRVIRCCMDFSRRMGYPNAILLTSTTGCSATLLGGMTWFKAMKLSKNAKTPRAPGPLQLPWSRVAVLIVDESSYLTPTQLWRMHLRMNQLRGVDNVPGALFGRVHTVLAGDLYQLKPAVSFWENPDPMAEKAKDDDGKKGFELWRTFNASIELETNYRTRGDPEWGSLLKRMRTNRLTEEDVQRLNKRVISAGLKPPQDAVVGMHSNKDKSACNFTRFKRALANRPIEHDKSWRQRGALRVPATVRRGTHGEDLTDARMDQVRWSTFKQLDNREGYLNLLLGGRIIVNKNQAVQTGVANGTEAILVGIVLHRRAEPVLTRIPGESSMWVHTIEAKHIRALIAKHPHGSPFAGKKDYDALPKGCFPIPLDDKYTKTFQNSENKFSVKIDQFPVSPAFSLTIHKCQGRSLLYIVVGPPGNLHKHGFSGWLYVAASRVTTEKGLYLTEPLDTRMHLWRPRTYIEAEVARLRRTLVVQTTKNMEALTDCVVPLVNTRRCEIDAHDSELHPTAHRPAPGTVRTTNPLPPAWSNSKHHAPTPPPQSEVQLCRLCHAREADKGCTNARLCETCCNVDQKNELCPVHPVKQSPASVSPSTARAAQHQHTHRSLHVAALMSSSSASAGSSGASTHTRDSPVTITYSSEEDEPTDYRLGATCQGPWDQPPNGVTQQQLETRMRQPRDLSTLQLTWHNLAQRRAQQHDQTEYFERVLKLRGDGYLSGQNILDFLRMQTLQFEAAENSHVLIDPLWLCGASIDPRIFAISFADLTSQDNLDLILPVHLGGRHWVLAHYNADTHTLNGWDSITENEDFLPMLHGKMQEVAKHIRDNEPPTRRSRRGWYKTREWAASFLSNTVGPVLLLKQPSTRQCGLECGVIVVVRAIFLLLVLPVPRDVTPICNEDVGRRWMAEAAIGAGANIHYGLLSDTLQANFAPQP
jgi:hypothetical protein